MPIFRYTQEQLQPQSEQSFDSKKHQSSVSEMILRRRPPPNRSAPSKVQKLLNAALVKKSSRKSSRNSSRNSGQKAAKANANKRSKKAKGKELRQRSKSSSKISSSDSVKNGTNKEPNPESLEGEAQDEDGADDDEGAKKLGIQL